MRYKLSDVVDIIGGGTPKRSIEEYWNGNIPWISIKDFSTSRWIEDTIETITDLGLNHSSTKILNKDDLIISARGTVGLVAQLKKEMAFNQSCYGLKAKKDILLNEYLYYWLKQNITYIKNNVHGSVFDTITRDTFDSLVIEVPELVYQKKVVSLLSPLDSKIELNNQMIATLEELAAVLFNRWFVDFEFPDENGNPYKSSGGKMMDSELGEIPEGWKVKQLNEICEVKDGTHDSPKQQISGYPLVTSKHLGNNKIDFETAKLISPEDYKKVNQRSKVDTDDILISMIGTVGRLYFVSDERINFAIKNIGLIKTSTLKEDAYFIFLQLSSDRLKKYVQTNQAGSTQQYISLTNLRKMPIILPEWNKLRLFNEITENISLEIRKVVDENANLIEIRDKLLPRLLSGELEI